jgi:hypothetical protein
MNKEGVRPKMSESGGVSRPDRLTVIGFLGDPATEQVVRDGLGDLRHGEDADAGGADR